MAENPKVAHTVVQSDISSLSKDLASPIPERRQTAMNVFLALNEALGDYVPDEDPDKAKNVRNIVEDPIKGPLALARFLGIMAGADAKDELAKRFGAEVVGDKADDEANVLAAGILMFADAAKEAESRVASSGGSVDMTDAIAAVLDEKMDALTEIVQGIGNSQVSGGEGMNLQNPYTTKPMQREAIKKALELMGLSFETPEGVRTVKWNEALVYAMTSVYLRDLVPAIELEGGSADTMSTQSALLHENVRKAVGTIDLIYKMQKGNSQEVEQLRENALTGSGVEAVMHSFEINLRVIMEKGEERLLKLSVAEMIDFLMGNYGEAMVAGEVNSEQWTKLMSVYGGVIEAYYGFNQTIQNNIRKRFLSYKNHPDGYKKGFTDKKRLKLVDEVLKQDVYVFDGDYEDGEQKLTTRDGTVIEKGDFILMRFLSNESQKRIANDERLKALYDSKTDPLRDDTAGEGYSGVPGQDWFTLSDSDANDHRNAQFEKWLAWKSGIETNKIMRIEGVHVNPEIKKQRFNTKTGQVEEYTIPFGVAKNEDVADIETHPAYMMTEGGNTLSDRSKLYGEVVHGRFGLFSQVAEAILLQSHLAVDFDRKLETMNLPDMLIKMHLGEAYFEKYKIKNPYVRSMVISLYADLIFRKQGFLPVVQAMQGKEMVLRSKDPHRLNDVDIVVGKIDLDGVNADGNKEFVMDLGEGDVVVGSKKEIRNEIIESVFFAFRGNRFDFEEELINGNTLMAAAEAGESEENLMLMAQNIWWSRVLSAKNNAFALESGRVRSRQEMLGMMQGMSADMREAIADVDFTAYLKSFGVDTNNMLANERMGWLGLRKVVQNYSLRDFDWGKDRNLLERQTRYGGAASEQFGTIGAFADKLIHAIDSRKLRLAGIDLTSGSFSADSAGEKTMQELVALIFPNLQDKDASAKFFQDLMGGVVEIGGTSAWLASGSNAQMLKDLILNTSAMIAPTVFEAVYVLEANDGSFLESPDTKGYSGMPGVSRKNLSLKLEGVPDANKAIVRRNIVKTVKGTGVMRILGSTTKSAYLTSPDGVVIQKIKRSGGYSIRKGGVEFVKEKINVFGEHDQKNVNPLAPRVLVVELLCMALKDAGILTNTDEQQVKYEFSRIAGLKVDDKAAA